jgi:hypothetical protein
MPYAFLPTCLQLLFINPTNTTLKEVMGDRGSGDYILAFVCVSLDLDIKTHTFLHMPYSYCMSDQIRSAPCKYLGMVIHR